MRKLPNLLEAVEDQITNLPCVVHSPEDGQVEGVASLFIAPGSSLVSPFVSASSGPDVEV
jgi:hypothetical protein